MDSDKPSPDCWLGFRARLNPPNVQLQHLTEFWPWQQTRVLNPLSLPLSTLWLPRGRQKRDEDLVEASEVKFSLKPGFAAVTLDQR
jgi:hypothetical protein